MLSHRFPETKANYLDEGKEVVTQRTSRLRRMVDSAMMMIYL